MLSAPKLLRQTHRSHVTSQNTYTVFHQARIRCETHLSLPRRLRAHTHVPPRRACPSLLHTSQDRFDSEIRQCAHVSHEAGVKYLPVLSLIIVGIMTNMAEPCTKSDPSFCGRDSRTSALWHTRHARCSRGNSHNVARETRALRPRRHTNCV